jgi:hypothetical protein
VAEQTGATSSGWRRSLSSSSGLTWDSRDGKNPLRAIRGLVRQCPPAHKGRRLRGSGPISEPVGDPDQLSSQAPRIALTLVTLTLVSSTLVTSTLSPLSRNSVIKGPGLKLSCDVRRFWKCPECSRSVRLSASQASATCNCSGRLKWMKLVEPTPLHPGVRPLPEPGSRPAIRDDARPLADAVAVATETVATEEATVLASPVAVPGDSVPVADEQLAVPDLDEPQADGETSGVDSSDEKLRNRHDKRRRRPRRSGKRRRKGGNSESGSAPDAGGVPGSDNS